MKLVVRKNNSVGQILYISSDPPKNGVYNTSFRIYIIISHFSIFRVHGQFGKSCKPKHEINTTFIGCLIFVSKDRSS